MILRKSAHAIIPGDSIIFSDTLTHAVVAVVSDAGGIVTLLLRDRRPDSTPYQCTFDRNHRVKVIANEPVAE